MKAEIIAIGSELLLGKVVNTNATYLSKELNKLGIGVFYHSVVGDNPERMKEAFDLACSRSDFIITTGGLGPTLDDITHDVIADFFDAPLKEDHEQKQIIKEKFTGRDVPEINFRQAQIPEGAKVIPNPIGTAPGIILSHKNVHIATLPGVPCEMEAMFNQTIEPFLQEQLKNDGKSGAIFSREIRFVGITESQMAQIVEDLTKEEEGTLFHGNNPSLAPYATLGECYLRITAHAESNHEARNLIQPVQMQIERILGDYVYGYDDDTPSAVLANKLIENNWHISFAESCSGGLLSKMMTDIPGASSFTKLNLVTYANEAKSQMLNIPLEDIDKHGAVSAYTAKAMVQGLSKISNSEVNVSITGIAGPDGGTEEKPIGTIYIGIKFPSSEENCHNTQAKLEKSKLPLKEFEIEFDSESNSCCIVGKLDWLARRPLTREQVRELAAKKLFILVYKLIS